MKYLNYYNCDTKNGEGVRCTLFVSGCEIGCIGCHNPESWKLNNGVEYTEDFENQIIEDLKNPYISGLSLSGGHPLHPKNYDTILSLCKRIKHETNKSIWLWTGLTYDQLINDYRSEILTYIDVLVDGKFENNLKDVSLKLRGSSNQNIYKITNGIGDIVD